MKMRLYIGLVLAAIGLVGCTALEKKQQAGAAVELNGQYLYRSTLDSLALGLDSVDSARVCEQYIRQWAEEILVFESGERRMSDNERARIERMVEEYRHTLYAQAHEQRLIERRMPKTVPDSAVQAFYDQMPNRFTLDESIMKGLLLVVPKDAPKAAKLRQWLMKINSELMGRDETLNAILDDIEKYAYQNASGYELFLDKWLTTTQMLSRVPVERAELENKLKYHNHIEMADSAKTYILHITDKHMRGEAMPVDYARPQIEKILLTRRQVDFLREERERMYEEAVKEKKINFF